MTSSPRTFFLVVWRLTARSRGPPRLFNRHFVINVKERKRRKSWSNCSTIQLTGNKKCIPNWQIIFLVMKHSSNTFRINWKSKPTAIASANPIVQQNVEGCRDTCTSWNSCPDRAANPILIIRFIHQNGTSAARIDIDERSTSTQPIFVYCF